MESETRIIRARIISAFWEGGRDGEGDRLLVLNERMRGSMMIGRRGEARRDEERGKRKREREEERCQFE